MSPRRRVRRVRASRSRWPLMALTTCLITHVVLDSSTWSIRQVQAAPARPAARGSERDRGLARRLELWSRPADGPGLRARYQLTRSSSLLYAPLRSAGELTLGAPDRLELRDDGPAGATTRISGASVTIVANDPDLPPGPRAAGEGAGRRWLRERLLALLLARDQAALLADTVVSVPRGPGLQLELSPARNHPARHELQRLRVQLHPDTGEVLELQLTEAGGDQVTLTLSDHQRAP